MVFTRHYCNLSSKERLNYYSQKLVILIALISFTSSCRGSTSKTTTQPSSVNSKPEETLTLSQKATKISDPTSPQKTPATISEIQSQIVWLRQLKSTSEIVAKKGMGINIGETIRTEGNALAQINLKNGLAFRIGNNATLTLQPDNRLNLTTGEMITWVNPGKKVATQIITPGGVAGIRGTTIHVKMPKNSKDAIEFFTWEGVMFIQLPNQSEEFQLKAGEIVKIKPGEENIRKVRTSIRRLTPQEWLTRRNKSVLINNFDQPLPTLSKIDQKTPVVKRN